MTTHDDKGEGDYDEHIALYTDDPTEQAMWRDLRHLLLPREMWWFSPTRLDDEEGRWITSPPGWFFGPLPKSGHLALSVSDRHYLLYRVDTDSDETFADLSDVARWLDAHESEHGEITAGEHELLDDLLKHYVERWQRETPPEPGSESG